MKIVPSRPTLNENEKRIVCINLLIRKIVNTKIQACHFNRLFTLIVYSLYALTDKLS